MGDNFNAMDFHGRLAAITPAYRTSKLDRVESYLGTRIDATAHEPLETFIELSHAVDTVRDLRLSWGLITSQWQIETTTSE